MFFSHQFKILNKVDTGQLYDGQCATDVEYSLPGEHTVFHPRSVDPDLAGIWCCGHAQLEGGSRNVVPSILNRQVMATYLLKFKKNYNKSLIYRKCSWSGP